MKLEKWALIAEILSAIAVVASLVFVGLQVRQGAEETALNTRAIQTSAYQDLTAQISILNTLIIENSDLAEALSRLNRGEALENELARTKMGSFMTLLYRHGEMAYVQYQNGLINEDQRGSMLAPTAATLRLEMGQQVWDANTGLSSEFKRYVQEHVAD
jgi:hypothetical protein